MADTLIWMVYDHPTQYPDYFVLRLWKAAEDSNELVPTEHMLMNKDLSVLRTLMSRWGLRRIPPILGDDPSIMEVWL